MCLGASTALLTSPWAYFDGVAFRPGKEQKLFLNYLFNYRCHSVASPRALLLLPCSLKRKTNRIDSCVLDQHCILLLVLIGGLALDCARATVVLMKFSFPVSQCRVAVRAATGHIVFVEKHTYNSSSTVFFVIFALPSPSMSARPAFFFWWTTKKAPLLHVKTLHARLMFALPFFHHQRNKHRFSTSSNPALSIGFRRTIHFFRN